MSRRIEVELTSDKGDGSWTWRAAGARLPKGELDGALLYSGAKVGDVVRADADFDIDGITILAVLAPKGARATPETLEIIGPKRESGPLVTSQLVPGRKGDRDGRAERGERKPRSARPGDDRPGHSRQGEAARTERAERPKRPAPLPVRAKAKKLRPGRVNRDRLIESLPAEQRPIAEQVLVGGLPAVRSAIEAQNTKALADGLPMIPVDAVLTMAEGLLPRLQVADWLDRAEAAMADVEELSLRDLRSVVTSADVVRDEATRELGAQLREALDRRIKQESEQWLADLTQSVKAGRVVRSLRLTARPPDASVSVPAEISETLTVAVNSAMASDTLAERWLMLVDALAFSSVRTEVVPVGIPSEPSEELLAMVRKHVARMPGVAKAFGIEAPAPKAARRSSATKAKKSPSAPIAPHRERARGPAVLVGGRRIPPPPPPRKVVASPEASETTEPSATETAEAETTEPTSTE